jgi:hypothetical protein
MLCPSIPKFAVLTNMPCITASQREYTGHKCCKTAFIYASGPGPFQMHADSPCPQNYWTGCLTIVLIVSKDQLATLVRGKSQNICA